jgi:glycosyltransferase involved in cell wall biosynthesis
MDLVGQMLLEQWSAASDHVKASHISLPIPRMVRRIAGARKRAFNADRSLARYLAYPVRAVIARRPHRFFHVVDHSYSQLVHVLPSARTGVYCHDLDAFQSILGPPERRERRSPLFRALARTLLSGLRSAAVVFHSTREVGHALKRLVPPSRLVHAPYGVAPEFSARPDPDDGADDVLSRLGGRPFVLHVGNSLARKRLDVLFAVFAHLRASRPELRLVQQGADLSAAQRAQIERLRIEESLIQPAKLARETLAGLYRRASVVLVTSDAEGFGFPVIEALACGAIVVASDIPVLREVGGDAAVYAPVGDVQAWSAVVGGLLDGQGLSPPRDFRIQRASGFSWERHARTILAAYEEIAGAGQPKAQAPSPRPWRDGGEP